MDTILDDLTQRSLDMLAGWAKAAERHWYPLPGHPGLGCYGTGYNAWGVQTNQKYLAAMAVLAGHRGGGKDLERALAALRFSLQTHLTGRLACTDGTQWGHTWISALGIERMMHAVHLLGPHLTEADRDLLRAVLTSEADWLVQHYERNGIREVTGGLWESSGRNQPESNVWNGALLWRTAALYPDDPRAGRWRERAHLFLVNAISVPGDAEDGTVLAGMRVRDRFRGANFFPHYALDHRGFMNVGYTVICVAGAAMLHFDLRLAGLKAPETLHHHQAGRPCSTPRTTTETARPWVRPARTWRPRRASRPLPGREASTARAWRSWRGGTSTTQRGWSRTAPARWGWWRSTRR